MLKKQARLQRVAFDRSFALGKRSHTPYYTLVHVPEDAFRASAVAPKKVFRTAVERNTFRRRVYDIFRHVHAETKCTGTYICIARSGARGASYAVLRDTLRAGVEKIGALG
jgi:ribonuclease P protein component